MLPTNVRRPSMRSLVGLMLVFAALLGSVTPLHAQETRPVNPNTIVSSDGQIVERDRQPASQMTAASPSYSGSGDMADSGIDVISRVSDDGAIEPASSPNGEGRIDSVIGADGRIRITNTTSYPYRAIAHITSSIGGCTGWLINANTVATAGHCVHGSNGWATNIRVYPGRNGTSTPYGSCTGLRAYSVSGWTTNRSPEYDYGAIKLNCTVGNTTGWFGYRYQTTTLTGTPSYLAGYPGDKTYGTLWRHNDQIRVTQTRRLFYANDTYGGQSGSPVWDNNSSCNPCAIAIHAYGVGSNGYNGGTRVTQEVFNNLNTWKNAP